jgi:hypothetical protein
MFDPQEVPLPWRMLDDATHKEDTMQRHFACALAVISLCAMTAGCVPPKPASPSMFYGNCVTPMGRDPCDSDEDICRVYEEIIAQKHATLGACRTACNQAFQRLGNQYFAQNCFYMFDRGSDLCEQECLRQYPKK